jgi:hypothetical protein
MLTSKKCALRAMLDLAAQLEAWPLAVTSQPVEAMARIVNG